MSQKPIPDFTETELWVVRTTLKERYGKDIPIELAEDEIMLGGEIVDVLQVEAGHMRKQKQKLEELQAKAGNKPSSPDDSDDSLTPLFWGD